MVIQALFVTKANDLHSQFTQYFTCIWTCQTGIFDLSHYIYMSKVLSPHFRWCRVNLYNIRQSGALRISSDGQFQDFRIVLKLCEIRWNIHNFFCADKKKLEEFSPPNFFFEIHGTLGIIIFCSCVNRLLGRVYYLAVSWTSPSTS